MFENIKYIRDKKLKKILTEIKYDMFMNGTSFSDAFKVYDKSFPPEIVPLLRMGEATGTMDVAVKSCESLLRMRVDTEKAVKDEMTYPLFIVLVMIVIFFVAALFILPSLGSMIPNGSVANIENFLRGALIFIAVMAVVCGVLKILCGYFEPIGRFCHMLKLYLPVFGRVEQAKVTAIFTLCLDIMMKNGLSGTMIYDMLMRVVPNRHIRANLEESYGSLLDGVSIDVCLRTTKGFLDFFYTIPIVSTVVDEDGKSPLMICSEYSKNEMRIHLKKIVSFVQPVMLLLIAVVLVTVFLSVILPTLQSMQGLLDML